MKLKTNMIMEVRIGDEGVLTVGHKEQLFKVREILDIGNRYINHNIGNSAMWDGESVRTYLRSESTWRTIIAIHNNQIRNDKKIDGYSNHVSKVDGYSPNLFLDTMETMRELPRVKTNQRMIDYVKVLKTKQFAHIVRTQNGGKVENRGTYVNLYLAIDLAMKMNERFKVELIHTFIEGKLLNIRDEGGHAFKEVKEAMRKFPDRIKRAKEKKLPVDIANHTIDWNLANMVRAKIGIEDSEGYNEEVHGQEVLDARLKIYSSFLTGIELGFIDSWSDIKKALKRIKL